MRVGILHNPLSGRNQRNPEVISAVREVADTTSFSEVITPEDIHKALMDFSRHQVSTLLINGGDGTIQATIDALFNHRPFDLLPQLAILPAGTANMIAGDVGLGPFAKHTLQKFFKESRSDNPGWVVAKRPVLRIQFHPHRQPMHGMFFGAGALCHGTQMGRETKQSIGRLGEWGAGLIFLKFLLALATGSKKGLSPVSIGMSMPDGHLKHEDYVIVLVTTLDRLILGLKPFWDSSEHPLRLTSVQVPFRHFWRVLPTALRGKAHSLALPQNGYLSKNLPEVRFLMKDGFVLDGEVYPAPAHEETLHLDSSGELSFLCLPK